MSSLRLLMLHEDTREPGQGGGAESLLRDQTKALQGLGHTVKWWHGKSSLAKTIEEFKPDICHVGTIHNFLGMTPVLYLQRERIPHIWAIMDYWPFCGGRMLLKNRDESCSAVKGECDMRCEHLPAPEPYLEAVNRSFVVALNPYTAEIYERNGMRCDAVVELGVDTGMFKPDYSKRTEEVSVFTSSAWPEYPQKGMPILQEAIKGMSINVKLMAHMSREKIAEGLKMAHIYVFPSCYEETWGLCLNEAMASGCACIASDVAGARAQVHEGMGLLVPPRNPEALREAIKWMLANPVAAEMMGAKAKEHVEKEHSLEAMGKRWESIYQQVLSREVQHVG